MRKHRLSGVGKRGSVIYQRCLWQTSRKAAVLGVQIWAELAAMAKAWAGKWTQLPRWEHIEMWVKQREVPAGGCSPGFIVILPPPVPHSSPVLPCTKSTNAISFSQLTKQMINRWKTSLRRLEPKGKYRKAEGLRPEVSAEMSLPLIALEILVNPVVFTCVKQSLVFP